VLYEDRSLRADPSTLASNSLGQPGLWRFSISGDLPILLVRVRESDDAALVRECLQAQEYWRLKGLLADLVVINEHPPGYIDEVHASLVALFDRGPWRTTRHRPGGAYLLRADEMTDAERTLMASVARAVLDGPRGGLRAQLDRAYIRRLAPPPVDRVDMELPPSGPSLDAPVPTLRFAQEFGGFTEDGREYVITRDAGRYTPLPWVNVIANPGFGTVLTEAGSAHTWAINSRENRLTPFANDPVCDQTAEAWFIRDGDTGEICAPPGPVPVDTASRRDPARRGIQPLLRVHAQIGGELQVSVDVASVRIQRLTLTNTSSRPRDLTLCIARMGPGPAGSLPPIGRDEPGRRRRGVRQPGVGRRLRDASPSSVSTPVCGHQRRRSFLGRHGSTQSCRPARRHPRRRRRRPRSVCGTPERPDTHARRAESWCGCQSTDADAARRVIATQACPMPRPKPSIGRGFLGRRVRPDEVTPDGSFMSCQSLARTDRVVALVPSRYHQPGGAFGFRDQLQDVSR
jgi:cyclic beta-1,2-glucan synthetase